MKKQKIEKSITWYSGVCPTCKKEIKANLQYIRYILMPPPIITVSCQCEIPVTTVELFYIK
jgi:hypothetical protein